MKMFRSLRFCYLLTHRYRIVGNVAPVKLKNTPGISTLSSAAYPMRGKISSINEGYKYTDYEEIRYVRLSLSSTYWQAFFTADVTDINWDECLTGPEVPREKYINTNALIFLVCQEKKFYNCAISFFKYLWDKKEITPGLLALFCNIMFECPENLKSCEDLLYKIFLDLRSIDSSIMKICSSTLLQSKKYSEIVYKQYRDYISPNQQHMDVIKSLLQSKKTDKALELYVHNLSRLTWVEKMLLEGFLEQASKGNLPVHNICKLLNFIPNFPHDITIPEENIQVLMQLFNKLKLIDENYTWICHKSKLHTTCPNCHGKLTLADVTDEEVKLLLKDLEDSVVIQDNIFLKTNHKEWNEFNNLIEKTDYNIVLDGLNIRHFLKGYDNFVTFISDLISQGIVPLCVGRSHFQRYPEYKYLKSKFPVFLTENLSDDDVFVLYAALKKGKGCYTLSNDKMAFCHNMLSSDKYQHIYKRWKASHHCQVSFSRKFLLPSFVVDGLQKCEGGKEGEFRYHFVWNQSFFPADMICISRISKSR